MGAAPGLCTCQTYRNGLGNLRHVRSPPVSHTEFFHSKVTKSLELRAGVTKFLSTSVAGFLLQKELDYLDGAVKEPKRPFVAIVGGSKVSSKIGVIESLIEKVDKIILG